MKVGGLIKYLKVFNKAKVLVLGDVMMDHFIWGKVSRISPEAPVPVVSVTNETLLLGGAANVVNNITSLGGKAEICGVIGNDDMGRSLITEIKSKGIITPVLMTDVLKLAKKNGVMVVVDPKVNHFNLYKGVTVITPNNLEASNASGVEIENESSLKRAGEVLLNRLGCDALLITRGEHGMSLFENTGYE